MKDQLTDRQRQVYEFLVGFWQTRGYPPSIREVASHFGFKSTRAVVDHLGALERKGWINRTRERSRANDRRSPGCSPAWHPSCFRQVGGYWGRV